jgi:hypothetical protein
VQAAPSYFILQYKYIPEIMEKRDPHRQGHLDAIKKGVLHLPQKKIGVHPPPPPPFLNPQNILALR